MCCPDLGERIPANRAIKICSKINYEPENKY
jgi:hypothetical protein